MGLNLTKTLRKHFPVNRNMFRLRNLTQLFRSHEDRGKERYRRAFLSGAASLVQRGLTLLISVVSVPLTIHYLGSERYGVWLTISSFLVWLAMTDLGLAGNGLINVVSDAHGRDDKRSAQEYVASALWSLVALSSVLGIVAWLCFSYISWTAVFHSTSIPPGELAAACALTMACFLIGLPLNIQYAVYSAYQDGAVSNAYGIVANIGALAALVVVTHFSGGLPQLVIALFGTRLVINFISTIYIFIRYPWLVPIPSAVRWQCIRKLLSLGSKYSLSQLGDFGILQSQPLIITQILGPAAVVPFVVTQRLITLPMEVVFLSTSSLVPAFGEAKARDDWGWIRNAYRGVTSMSVYLGIPLVLILGLVAQPVIRIWAGPAAVPGWLLILGLVIYNMVGVTLMGTTQLLTGIERLLPLVSSKILCAVSIIGIGILGCELMGGAGVALAMAVSKLVTYWPIQVLAVRKLFRSEHSASDFVVNEEVA